LFFPGDTYPATIEFTIFAYQGVESVTFSNMSPRRKSFIDSSYMLVKCISDKCISKEDEDCLASAYWISSLNRNGVLHRIRPHDMEKIHTSLPKEILKYKEVFPGRKYCHWESFLNEKGEEFL
jgi:hypothetical protein